MIKYNCQVLYTFHTERETNEERQRRFVNHCRHLSLLSIHISVMAIHVDWLGKEQMIPIDV